MQVVKIFKHASFSFSPYLLIMLAVVRSTFSCQAQSVNCADSLTIISKAYADGEWSRAKSVALGFLNNPNIINWNFASNTYYRKLYSKDCNSYIPQAYFYLIKSYFRLFELDSAKAYYNRALKKGIVVNFDSTDNNLNNYFNYKVRKYSLGIFSGSTTNFIKVKFNQKTGLQFGMNTNSFLETYFELAFNQRYFNHISTESIGTFGAPLSYNPNIYPNYNFDIAGTEKFIDLAYFLRFPIRVPFFSGQSGNPSFYIPFGVYVSYYLNSSVSRYKIVAYRSSTDSAKYDSSISGKKKFTTIEGLNMDLRKLYRDPFNYGFFYGVGINSKFSNDWTFFGEIRYTVGRNFRYQYNDFKSFKIGVSYFTFMIGFTKDYFHSKTKRKKI